LWRHEEGSPTDPLPAPTGSSSDKERSQVLWRSNEGGLGEGVAPDDEGAPLVISPLEQPARRRGWPRRVAMISATILVALFAADLAFSVVRLRRSLGVISVGLRNAQRYLGQEDLGAAADEVALATANARYAADAEDRPALAMLATIPGMGDDARTIRAISQAARRSVEAASAVIDAAEEMSLSGGDFASALYRDGQLQVDTIQSGTDDISRAASLLRDAVDVLDDAPEGNLAPVSEALMDARRQLSQASEAAANGEALFQVLPGFAGSEEPATYLLAFQAPSEARATGGFIGFYGILHASAGEFRLGHTGPVRELLRDERTPVAAPAWFAENYSGVGALLDPRLVNSSPNFPVVSDVLLNLYDAAEDESLDGVVAMDPLALAEMMKATGPIDVPGYPDPVTSESAADLIMHDSYLRFDGEEQNVFLTRLIGRFWRELRDADFESAVLAEAIGEAVSTRHLQLYSRDDEVQSGLVDLEAAGDYQSAGPNVQLVFHNNYGTNKVDYFLERSIDTSIELGRDGSADVTTRVTMVNNAPPGPDSPLLTSADEDVATGVNSMLLNYLVPETSEILGLRMSGERERPFEYFDEDFPVAWAVVEIPPGESISVTLRYRVHGAVEFVQDAWRASFTMVPQPTATPDRYSISILPPDGFTISTLDGEPTDDSTAFRDRGILDRKLTVEVGLAPR
jgi:hypothetical protein